MDKDTIEQIKKLNEYLTIKSEDTVSLKIDTRILLTQLNNELMVTVDLLNKLRPWML